MNWLSLTVVEKQWSKGFCLSYRQTLSYDFLCKTNPSLLRGDSEDCSRVPSGQLALTHKLLDFVWKVKQSKRVCYRRPRL